MNADLFERMCTAMIGADEPPLEVDEATQHTYDCKCAECCEYWDNLMFGAQMEGDDGYATSATKATI